jgi:hypothetical protein
MKLVASVARSTTANPEVETLALSREQLDYLERISQSMNPQMPGAFGWPHVVRAILDRVEKSGIDLTAACSEEEITELAASGLRGRYGRRTARLSEPLSASRQFRRADRPAYRANRPARGRCRSGTPPRSDRE